MPKNPPEGYRTVTPFFQLKEANAFIDFVKQAFNAEQTELMRRPDGTVAHAEFRIGDSLIMLAEGDVMPLALYLYLDDVDAVYRKALAAGGQTSQEPMDQFWGDRQAAVKDRWGNMWFIATNKEDVPVEEMERRMAAARP